MTEGIDLSFIVQPLWSRVSATQWHGSLSPPLLAHCSALWGQVATWFLHIVILWGWVYCVCLCVGCVCARFTFACILLCDCVHVIFLPCRHPEHWLVITLIPWFCRRTRSSLCRDTPPVLGYSTPDNLPLLATTANSGPAPSRLSLQYSDRHGATYPLSSQAQSPLCITTMGIPKARLEQIPMAAISLGCLSPCPVPCPWPEYRRLITTESNLMDWGRDLTARHPVPTRHCFSLITPTGRWRRHHRRKRTYCPATQGKWAGRQKRNRAWIQVSLRSVYILLFIPHKAVRTGVMGVRVCTDAILNVPFPYGGC